MNILIAGASGYVGTLLIKKLAEENHNIKCISRSPKVIESRFPDLNLTTYKGDLLSVQEGNPSFEDIDVAYYLVHSLSGGKDFPAQELKCAQNFITAANAAKIPKVIYLGGLANDQSELSKHLKSPVCDLRAVRMGRFRRGAGNPLDSMSRVRKFGRFISKKGP